MPERNLVRGVYSNHSYMILVVALTIISVQLGCSKLGQSTFNQDLLSGKRSQPRWRSDPTDSASRYVADPDADLNTVKQKDEARIVGIGDGDSSDIDVKLVASQPPATDGTTKTDSPKSVNDLFCEHSADCDCQKPKIKPKLPFAEPIDPPPITAKAPPSGLIHQPLTPILFDMQTREIQSADVESNNSLRRNQQWSHEKVASLTNKQSAIDLAVVDSNPAQSNPVRFNPSKDQISQPIVGNDLSRSTNAIESSQTGISDFKTRALPVCVSCHEAKCDGTCNKPTTRIAAKFINPIVTSEPIVIVATTSADTIPPFAECPPDDEEVEFAPELEIVMPESTTQPETSVVDVDSQSFDDLNDEDWLELFGPMDGDVPSCPACQSSQCQDPGCQVQSETEIVVAEFPSDPGAATISTSDVMVQENAGVAPAPTISDAKMETNIAQASSIESTSNAETDNDFQPVSHTAAVGNVEIEIELPLWSQPKTPVPSPVPPATETPEAKAPPVEVPKTVELPMLDLGPVSVPDGGMHFPRRRQPQTYSGPPVRFEIIDNTVPWTEKLSETIQNVQSRLAIENEPAARNGMEVNLRLLEVLQRQMADVEVRQDSLSDEEKQYWQHQLDAIALMLNSSDSADSDLTRHSTVINTLEHLRKAVERLESIAELQIKNGAFCTEVSGFGQFKAFPTTTFTPGQRMLVYCEVENYSTVQVQEISQTEAHTRLRGSYVIYDQQGRAVQQSEYPIVQDIARKRRRDFYMHFPIQLESLAPGSYKLELMVEDLNGNKTASIEPDLEFQVK
jgi:hypothetical protein